MNNYKDKFQNLYTHDSGIIELKYSDFIFKNRNKIFYLKNDINNINNGIIMVYAPWCKHCKSIADEFSKMSYDYMNIFYLGVINAEDLKNKNDILANKLGVSEYPKFFKLSNKIEVKFIEYDFKSIDDIKFYISLNT
jgi:thiol-disulfide isomerase/thioredoxin